MGNDNRKGNRSSVPSRGGLRRSNTPPPPTVRLGIDGQPEKEPISTSRPRGNELPKTAPVLENPPADIVAAAKPAESVAPKPEPVVAKAEPPPPPPPEPVVASAAPEDDGLSQAAPSVAPRRSGIPGGNRKGRGSNLKGSTGRSVPPPPMEPSVPPQAEEASTAKAPAVITQKVAAGAVAAVAAAEAEEEAPTSAKPASAPPADLDQHFFDHGERAAADAHHEANDLDGFDDRLAAQKNTPEARARRAKNWRIVAIASAASVLLLLVADVKSRWAHGGDSSSDAPVAVVVTPPVANNNAVAAPSVEPPVQVVVVPSASAAADMPPAGSGAPGAVASAGAPPADSAKEWVTAPQPPPGGSAVAAAGVTPPAAAEPTADDKKSAAQLKHSSQGFLDQGAFGEAVEAGERSVALDPSDGEAWLLLGAAYQSMGKGAEARRTFSSCVAEAKRGPIGECRAMLR